MSPPPGKIVYGRLGPLTANRRLANNMANVPTNARRPRKTLGRQALDEHRLVADLAKPQPLGEDFSDGGQRDQEEYRE